MNLKSTGGEGGVTLTREQCIARLEQAMRDEPLHEADPDYPYAVAILSHLRTPEGAATGGVDVRCDIEMLRMLRDRREYFDDHVEAQQAVAGAIVELERWRALRLPSPNAAGAGELVLETRLNAWRRNQPFQVDENTWALLQIAQDAIGGPRAKDETIAMLKREADAMRDALGVAAAKSISEIANLRAELTTERERVAEAKEQRAADLAALTLKDEQIAACEGDARRWVEFRKLWAAGKDWRFYHDFADCKTDAECDSAIDARLSADKGEG